MSRYLVYFHPGDPVPDRMKYIDDATAAPDANDDAATLGVTVGSLWIDTSNHDVYICEDASTGAAVWTELTGSGGSGAPDDVDYLVGTADSGLSNEIVVGTTPGGELGGTWASPTVDATHSGSTHAATQAAAEATAAAALSGHTGDSDDAHDASAISVLDTGGNFTATDVEAALAELAAAPGADWRDPTTLATDLSASGVTSIDRDDAATHDLTLSGNITITPTDTDPPGAGYTIDLRALVRGDGTSTLSFGGTITWATSDGNAPAAPGDGELLTIGFLSVDDGTTWLGFVGESEGGSAGTPAATVESETSFGISAAVGTDTEYARQDHTHGSPANPVTAVAVSGVGYWAPLVDSGSGDLIRDEDSNEVIMAFVPTP